MAKHPFGVDPLLAEEAKSLVVLAFRNGPIEDIHAGRSCPHCAGNQEYSHITDDEMKLLMKNAVNRVYELLWLKTHHPEKYQASVEFGARYTSKWDDPEVNLNS